MKVLQLAVALAVTLMACQKPAADQSAAAASAVRSADSTWEKTFVNRDTAGVVGFVEATGSVMPPNGPIATGPDAVRALFTGFWALPGISLHWQATSAEASQSGELAYSSGTYDLTFNGPDGKPVSDKGKFVTVWRKQSDGSWKVVRDIFNSDLPLTPPKM